MLRRTLPRRKREAVGHDAITVQEYTAAGLYDPASRIAAAAVTRFNVNVEQPTLESGGSELDIAKKNLRAIESLEGVRVMWSSLFGAHVETAIRRLREARPRRSPDRVEFAVGFVDL